MSDKLNLNNVTLFCIDDISPNKAASTIENITDKIEFGAVKIFSSRKEDGVTDSIDSPINSLYDYSVFAINSLHKYIDTEFAMCVQRDGYPINVKAWRDEFLEYDYIGAPWLWAPVGRSEICPVGNCVGNGGFSIRSKKLMEESLKYSYTDRWRELREEKKEENAKDILNEDEFICREISDELKSSGVKFAPVEVAYSFSIENMAYTGQFGFHGERTFEINKRLGYFK